MASIRPFSGLRYDSNAGFLDRLTAPPYDVLSPSERDAYAAREPHNVVHLTLPEQNPDDRSKYVKYARSAALLTAWRNEGALVKEPKPAIYRYTQHFEVPGAGRAFSRTSIIALIKIEPYEAGIVLPHEQTFPKHKEDRMRILEATRAHLECIFGLYEDPDGQVLKAILEAPAGPAAHAQSDDGVCHDLEPITDVDAQAALQSALAEKKVWIADGHHRYETALAFRQRLGEQPGPVAEDYMMMALCSISDPGLVLLPTHRIVKQISLSKAEMLRRLSALFNCREAPNDDLMPSIEAAHTQGTRAFGVAFPGGNGVILTERQKGSVLAVNSAEESISLKELDVTVLHRVILENLLNLAGLDQIAYTRDASEAVQAVEQGAAVSFLMNPPSVEDMQRIAMGGEKMPQKSTYYFPKILSGLVIWSLNDF